VAQVVEYLPSKCQALSSEPSTTKKKKLVSILGSFVSLKFVITTFACHSFYSFLSVHSQTIVFIVKSLSKEEQGGRSLECSQWPYEQVFCVLQSLFLWNLSKFHWSSPTDLPRIDFSSIAVPGTSSPRQRQPPRAQQPHSSPGEMASTPQGLDNPALLRDMLLANPHELSLLKERNPPLAEALLSGDLGKVLPLEGCQADLR
jgi:hypothetical protein